MLKDQWYNGTIGIVVTPFLWEHEKYLGLLLKQSKNGSFRAFYFLFYAIAKQESLRDSNVLKITLKKKVKVKASKLLQLRIQFMGLQIS